MNLKVKGKCVKMNRLESSSLSVSTVLCKTPGMDVSGAIKNIVREIHRECAHKNIHIYDNFLHHYVDLLALDPNWQIFSNLLQNRGEVQNFVKFVVEKLENQQLPNIITLKMQFYFIFNVENKKNMIKNNRLLLRERLEPLEAEIIAIKDPGEPANYAKLYKRIVYYSTLEGGLGNPSQETTFKESMAALKSILNNNELGEFMQQLKHTKRNDLHEFTKLITGIRLFHKNTGKGGEDIENLPDLLYDSINMLKANLQDTLIHVMERVNLFTTAIDNCYQTEMDDHCKCRISVNLPYKVQNCDLALTKDLLVLYRQYEIYVRMLLVNINEVEQESVMLKYDFLEALEELDEFVAQKVAILAYLIFPKFTNICDIWYKIQNVTLLVAKLHKILDNLRVYVSQCLYDHSLVELMVGPNGPLTDVQRLGRACGEKIPENKCRVYDLTDFENIDDIKLEYLGFCGWKLIETQGGLIPGNPNLGIVEFLNRFYVFSSKEAGQTFSAKPERYILQIIDFIREKPELIGLLQLKDQLLLFKDVPKLVEKVPEALQLYEKKVQTEIHPEEENIDPTYKWNVWDLKREAIMLANLVKCKTVSVQTEKSYFRFNVTTQTYDPKETISQTKTDNYTNVPKPSNFIYGLRGRKDNKQFIIDLTRPVNE